MRGRFNGRVVGQDYTGRNTRHNGRAGMYNAVQSALAPSLDITLANGLGPLFTYTRATTATVTDFEGLIKSCLSGELRVQGARRVENLIPAAGTGSASLAVAATKTMTLAAGDYVFSMGAGTGTATFSGTGGATGTLAANATSRTSVLKTITAGTLIVTASVATLVDLQVENVTGQANQNPSSYVSIGVLSSPYHGYFADGVKYFSYENGNTVASNVVTEAQGAAITGTIGYLAEGARTNSCLQSNGFGTTWSASAVSVSSGQTTAPDGTLTGWKLIEDNTNAPHYIRQSITQTAAGWTVSIRAKAGSASRYLGIFNGGAGSGGGGANACVAFDIINGTVGQVGSEWTSASITPLPGGWYLCTATATMQAGAAYLDIRIANAATTAAVNSGYSGDGSSFIYIAWASDEAGAFASSYIPTTTAAVARNADVLSCPFAGIFGTTGGTIYVEAASNVTGNFGTGAAQNALLGSGSGDLPLYGYSTELRLYDSAAERTLVTGLTAPATVTKYAVTYSGTTCQGAVNGVAGAAATFDGLFADIGASIQIGSSDGAYQWFGPIKKVRLYTRPQSTAQIVSMTS